MTTNRVARRKRVSAQRMSEYLSNMGGGTSSQFIWKVMMGLLPEHANRVSSHPPSDSGDFGRCYDLLKAFPEWRSRLDEIPIVKPWWGPIVREWPLLELRYEAYVRGGYKGGESIGKLLTELKIEGGSLLPAPRGTKATGLSIGFGGGPMRQVGR